MEFKTTNIYYTSERMYTCLSWECQIEIRPHMKFGQVQHMSAVLWGQIRLVLTSNTINCIWWMFVIKLLVIL